MGIQFLLLKRKYQFNRGIKQDNPKPKPQKLENNTRDNYFHSEKHWGVQKP